MKKACLFCLLLVFLAAGAIDPLGIFTPNKRIEQLAVLRAELNEYEHLNKRLPSSLGEYYAQNPKSILRRADTLMESTFLDFSGGWYYNPFKRVVGINEEKYTENILSLGPPVIAPK